MVADHASGSKIGPFSAAGRQSFPDEVAHQQAGQEGHGKSHQYQQRPGQNRRGLENHLADGLKLAGRRRERGRLDLDGGQDGPERRIDRRVFRARRGETTGAE